MAEWLSMQEYSNLQGLSISTLRRRVKAGEIDCQLKNGRWLLKAS